MFIRLPKDKNGKWDVVLGSGRLLLLSALFFIDGIVGRKQPSENLITEQYMQTLRELLDFEFLWCHGIEFYIQG